MNSQSAATPSCAFVRVKITGLLTLKSPLVLKDGTTRRGPKLDDESCPEIACVTRSADGRAMIPGSSLKGVLREYLTACNTPATVVERLFGRAAQPKLGGNASPDQGCGGSVEFGYAYSASPISESEYEAAGEQSVTIDRVTRTAADRRLFSSEAVPSGTIFSVTLLGFQLTKQELDALLMALAGFNLPNRPVRLGSGTSNGLGEAHWTEVKTQVLNTPAVQEWIAKSTVTHIPELWAYSKSYVPSRTQPAHLPSQVNFLIALNLEGWFLVRDPKGTVTHETSGKQVASPRLSGHPNDPAHGRKVLAPARSVRGVFRSQVERIARTLNPAAGGDPVRDTAFGIVEALFGFTGGRATLAISPFVDSTPSVPFKFPATDTSWPPPDLSAIKGTKLMDREFVAIDRFTGGAAEHLKFACQAAWRPMLNGTLSIDLRALQNRCRQINRLGNRSNITPAAALGFMFLALRDLEQGDLSFGMGAAKGFGRCEAASIRVSLTPETQGELEQLAALLIPDSPRPTTEVDFFTHPWTKSIYKACVRAARTALSPTPTVSP